jgi:Glutamyl-tRNAGlu reductase, N-terminal domain
MALSELIVLNRRTASGTDSSAMDSSATDTGPLPSACNISTCLREVRVAALAPSLHPAAEQCAATGFERFRGVDAYRFMLRLACGLESEIAGETEILGQIKEAWRDYERDDPEAAASLRPWMQRLLQDTKEIRSEHVVGLGSATYGSLVRRLLGAGQHGPTLLLGAGQLADAVLPWLEADEVWLWNRTAERARELVARQRDARSRERMKVVEASLEAEVAAWQRAHNVVICIPADPLRDGSRARIWQSQPGKGRLVHLGLESTTGTAWDGIPNVATLRDLFALRDTHASQREALLARARRACVDKAQLARLDDADGSRPGSANHGWEDLAVFQSFSY